MRATLNGSVSLLQELGPPLLKELPHVVSRAANVRVVLVELLAIVEHQVDVNDERLEVLVPKTKTWNLGQLGRNST